MAKDSNCKRNHVLIMWFMCDALKKYLTELFGVVITFMVDSISLIGIKKMRR